MSATEARATFQLRGELLEPWIAAAVSDFCERRGVRLVHKEIHGGRVYRKSVVFTVVGPADAIGTLRVALEDDD